MTQIKDYNILIPPFGLWNSLKLKISVFEKKGGGGGEVLIISMNQQQMDNSNNWKKKKNEETNSITYMYKKWYLIISGTESKADDENQQ